MIKRIAYLAAIFISGLLVYGCNESTLIGSNLLEGEEIDLRFTDTFDVFSYTTAGMRQNTGNSFTSTFPIGILDDPYFGKTTSEFYFGFSFLNDASLDTTTMDSIVFTMEFDTTGFYGDWRNATFDIKMFQGLESLPDPLDTIYDDFTVEVDPMPIAEYFNVSVNPFDSINLFVTDGDSVELTRPQFRVKLNQNIAEEIYGKIPDITSTNELLAEYPSFKLVVTPSRSATIGLNAGTSARLGSINGLNVYYTTNSGEKRNYRYVTSSVRFINIKHDYNGYPIEPFIDNKEEGNELIHVQGLGGVNTIIDLSNLKSLSENLINKAEIVLTIAEDAEYMTDIYKPHSSLGAGYIDGDGIFLATSDFGFVTRGADPFIFNGFIVTDSLDNGNVIKKVNINITNHIIDLLSINDISPVLIITSSSEPEAPNRTIFYGPNSPVYPAKLNIAYTAPR